jgi:hypothetical protein
MPRPSEKSAKAKIQHTEGNSSFTIIVEDAGSLDESSEWDEDLEEEWEDAKQNLQNLFPGFLPEHLKDGSVRGSVGPILI